MAERLGFEIFADDRASANLTKAGASLRRLAADVELAQTRVAKATATATAATEKFGAGSVQAREAAAKLAIAEDNAAKAATKMAAGQKVATGSAEETRASFAKLHPVLAQTAATAAGVWGSQVVTAGLQKFKAFAESSIEAASNLNESTNAVGKTFGSSAQTIQAWGATSATSYGMSQAAFQSMATPIGSVLKNTGLSMQDTARWTIDLSKRAADMASVFNTSVPDALEAIGSGLRGETEPLQRYGVGLTVASVQAEALSETHKATASQLTTTELAVARLNLIMKQTSQTQGDFASTSDQFANAQRRAAAELENAKAKLGQDLLPILARVSATTADVVGGFAGLPGPIQAAIVGVVGFGGASLLLLPKVAAAKAAIVEMGIASEATAGRIGKGAALIGKFTAVLIAAQVAGQAFTPESGAKGVNETTTALQNLVANGQESSGILTNLNGDLKNLGTSGRSMGKALEGLTGNFFGLAGDGAIANVDARISSLDASLANLVSSGKVEQAGSLFAALADKAKAQGTSLDTLKAAFPQYTEALAAVAPAAGSAGGRMDDLRAAADLQVASQQRLKDSLLATNNALLQLSGGEVGYWAAVDATTEAIKKNGKTLDVHTEKGRANKTALDGLGTSSLAYLNTMMAQGAPADQFNAQLDTSRQKLLEAAIRFGMTKDAAQAYVDKILSIPHVVNTYAGLNISQPLAAIETLNWKLGQINGRTVTAYIKTETLGSVAAPRGVAAARAEGGILPGAPSSRDNMLIAAASGEFVVNAHQTQRYLPLLRSINEGRFRGYSSGGLVSRAVQPAAVAAAPIVVKVLLDGQPFRAYTHEVVDASAAQQAYRARVGRR